MNKRVSILATAFAALAATAENPHFSPCPVSNNPDPDWKRKKCKSCKSFNKILGRNSCCSNPNQQACGSYKKRKK